MKTLQRLRIRTSPPEQRMPVEYGMFVEAFVFASQVIQHTASSPLPEELDEVDWFLLHSGIRPSPLVRGPLVALSAIFERYEGYQEQQALAARCQALFELLPHLPEDHFLLASERRFLHIAALEAASRSPLDGNLQFVRSSFFQMVRQAIPKYPPAQNLLTGELLGSLQKRFAGRLRSDLSSVCFEANGLAVQYQDQPESQPVALTGAPLRPGKDEAAQTANLFITLKWLIEADAQALIQAGVGQYIFTQTAIQEILSGSSPGVQP